MSFANTKDKTTPRRRISRIKRNSSNCHLPCSSARFFRCLSTVCTEQDDKRDCTVVTEAWQFSRRPLLHAWNGLTKLFNLFLYQLERIRKTANSPQHFSTTNRRRWATRKVSAVLLFREFSLWSLWNGYASNFSMLPNFSMFRDELCILEP